MAGATGYIVQPNAYTHDTLHRLNDPRTSINNYESLNKEPMKRDWDHNRAYTNEVEMMLKSGIEIMQTQFMNVGAEEGITLTPFLSTENRPVDPRVGWSLTMVGYTLPYEEHTLSVGEHLTARIHAEIPEVVMNTYNYFQVRNTYSMNVPKKLLDLPAPLVDEFYARQLAAFRKSQTNWLRFLSYLIFADLGEEIKQNNNGGQNEYPWKIDESVRDPFFENFKSTLFAPKMGQDKKLPAIPWRGLNLALEKVPVINPDYKFTTNDFLNHINSVREKLRRHKECWDITDIRFKHDVPDSAKDVICMREKATDVAYDMLGNSIKYRIEKAQIKNEGFAIFVRPSDLIMIMDERSEQILNETVPNMIKPNIFDFSPASIGVGRIIRSRWFKKGEALIIHKDALKMIITKNDVGTASYPEQGVVNTWHSLGYYLDTFGMFPCCFIQKKNSI